MAGRAVRAPMAVAFSGLIAVLQGHVRCLAPDVARAATALRLAARTDERLVLDPVGLERVRSARLLRPRRVLLEAPLEPGHLRVALEGEDVRRDPVEEPAVVRDDDR